MVNYPLGDYLIKIKNVAMAKGKTIAVEESKQILAVSQTLKKLGYLDEIKKEKGILNISLSFKNKKPVMMDLKLVSKPGLRIYMNVVEIGKKKGPSVYLISSPKGIVSSREAVKQRVGGEVIAEII